MVHSRCSKLRRGARRGARRLAKLLCCYTRGQTTVLESQANGADASRLRTAGDQPTMCPACTRETAELQEGQATFDSDSLTTVSSLSMWDITDFDLGEEDSVGGVSDSVSDMTSSADSEGEDTLSQDSECTISLGEHDNSCAGSACEIEVASLICEEAIERETQKKEESDTTGRDSESGGMVRDNLGSMLGEGQCEDEQTIPKSAAIAVEDEDSDLPASGECGENTIEECHTPDKSSHDPFTTEKEGSETNPSKEETEERTSASEEGTGVSDDDKAVDIFVSNLLGRVVAMHGRECEGDTQSTQRITESSEENTETDLLEEGRQRTSGQEEEGTGDSDDERVTEAVGTFLSQVLEMLVEMQGGEREGDKQCTLSLTETREMVEVDLLEEETSVDLAASEIVNATDNLSKKERDGDQNTTSVSDDDTHKCGDSDFLDDASDDGDDDDNDSGDGGRCDSGDGAQASGSTKTLPDSAERGEAGAREGAGRSSLGVFEVKLVAGLLGLGLTLGQDHLKDVVVERIRMFSSAAAQGELSVGDRILEINGCSVIGKSPSQAQKMLSEVKWGEEATILAMPQQETVVLRVSETANAGVIIMKFNTKHSRRLGIEVEGGTDVVGSPYISIASIAPGSLAEQCGLLRTGDELVEVDDHLMVGSTRREAVDILRQIREPVTLTVQRRRDFDTEARIKSRHSLLFRDT